LRLRSCADLSSSCPTETGDVDAGQVRMRSVGLRPTVGDVRRVEDELLRIEDAVVLMKYRGCYRCRRRMLRIVSLACGRLLIRIANAIALDYGAA